MKSESDINRTIQWTASEASPIERHSLYRKVDRLLRERPVGRVLELGCGSGRYLAELKARGWVVEGVELQPQAFEFIRQHDLTQPLPFSREFDVVLAVEVIEHIVDTDGFLENCASALKPGGILVLTTPNLLFVLNRVLMLFGRRPLFAYADYHVRMFVWQDLRTKVERIFSVRSLRGSHVFMGSRAGFFQGAFSWLGDRFPTMAAHFIVEAELRPRELPRGATPIR